MSGYTLYIQRIGLAGVARIIYSLRGLVILPLLTKSLGATDYGIYAQVLITVLMLQPFLHLSLGSALVRFLSSKEKKVIGQGILTILLVVLLTSTIGALIVFLFSDTLASSLLGEESAATAIRIGSVLIILEALCLIALGSFRIFGQIKRYAYILIFQTALEIGLIAIFVLSGYGLIGAIVSMIITRVIILIITLYLIISYSGFTSPDFSVLRRYLPYSLPLVPSSTFQQVLSSSDRYVIGHYSGAALVGIYSAAYSIGNIITMFSSLITYILWPTIFNLFDRGRIEEVRAYLSNSWKYLLMFAIPMAFGLSILAEPVLDIMTTTEFVSEGRFVIPLVSFSMVVAGVSQMYSTVVLLSKHTKIVAVAHGAAAALNLGLNILLVPYFGIIAAAITTLIGYIIVAIIMCYRARKYLIFDTVPNFIIKCILSAIAMTFIIWVINPASIVWLLLSILIGAIIYFVILFFLRGLTKNELKFLLELFK